MATCKNDFLCTLQTQKPDLVRDYTNVITKWKTGKRLCQNNYFIITWVSPFGVLVLEFSWTATYSGSLGRDKIINAVIIIHFTVKFSDLSGKEQVALNKGWLIIYFKRGSTSLIFI